MTSEIKIDVIDSPKTKKRGKLRWILLLFAAFAAMVCTVVSCGMFSLKRTYDVLDASGYVESWTEGVDGEKLGNVSYGEKDWNRLHLFFPKELSPEKSHAAFVYIHGGAWIGGSLDNIQGFAHRMTKAGYISASIEYMLYKEGVTDSFYSIAAIMDEIDAALAKIKEVAAERGIELERVALGGDSAGGHILSLYAYSRGKNAPLPVVFIAPRVAPIDFHVDAWDPVLDPASVAKLVNAMNRVDSATPELLNDPNEEIEALINAISPLAYLTADNTIPTVAAYGGKDPLVGSRHCAKLAAKFQALGAKSFNEVDENDSEAIVFDCFEYPHSGHMLESDPDCAKQFHELVLRYAARYLDDRDAAIQSESDGE